MDFNKYRSGMYGFIKLSKNLDSSYSGVPIIDTTGLKGTLALCTFAIPYSFPGLLLDGINFA